MSRSIWKGIFVKLNVLKKRKVKKYLKVNIWSRNSAIPYCFIDRTVFVHNGKIFKKITITREKIGYKFGEFVFTKIKNKPKKKKEKKKNGTKK